ncbi:PocR ligand-binding domain-containing protein [Geobacter sp.]|uniref:PocR ligand-binding domain-containing protein n=1 Tax=Geobacter sp. TaxID=46610 RepID=UPI002607048A|nr:PocR ligand-binding domain-containing protein [Geobacter sp.]
MMYHFSELIDVPRLQGLMEQFQAMTGVPVGIVDAEGRILVATGWQEICTKYHRVNPTTRERCRQSNAYIKSHLTEGAYVPYKCLNGLWDVGVPVIIAGQHVATLFLGQFFFEGEHPDIEFFRRQASEFGFDEADYLAALAAIPVFSREEVDRLMRYCEGFVSFVVDMGLATLRQREAEQALREQESQLRLILSSTAEAIYGLDLEGRCVFCNPACLQVLGYGDEGELLGRQMHEVLCHSRADGTPYTVEECAVVRAFREGECIHSADEVFWRADGTPFPVEYWAYPVRREEDTLVGAVVTFLDITERRRAEKALAASEEKFSKAFRTSPVMLGITTLAEGRFIEVNEAFKRTFGYRRSDVVGRTSLELNIWQSPAEREWIVGIIREEGAVREQEVTFRDRSGRTFTGLYSAELLELDGVPCLINMVADITDRKRAAERIEILNSHLAARAAELEVANGELEAFSYSLSHDLRSLVGQISLSAQLLRENNGECRRETRLLLADTIYDATERIVELVEAMLVLSRVTQSETRNKEVDLGVLAGEIILGLRMAEPEREVEFVSSPGLMVKGDPHMLRIALENLIGNAWKYTRKTSGATIGISVTTRSGERVFCVRDNGAGFDMREAGELFQPFRRLHRNEEFEGTGIGLATVRRVVQRHGGRIWAEAEPGRGAAFFFTLPGGKG